MRATLSATIETAATMPGARQAWATPRAATLAMVIACTIWGTSFVFGKIALRDLGVSHVILLRFVLASVTLLPVLIWHRSQVPLRDLPLLFLTGVLAVPLSFLLQFQGLALTTISRASLIVGAAPPLMAMGGMVFFGERPGLRIWTAVAVSLAGIAAISGFPGGGGSWIGDGLVFLSTVTSVVWVMIIKRVSQRLTSLVATSTMIIFGTLSLIPLALLEDGFPRLDLPLDVWLSVGVLGVACTALAFVLWNWGLEHTPASRAGLFLNIEPVVGALLGITLWGDSVGAGLLLGGALILGAALWVSDAGEGESAAHDPIREPSSIS
jgi:drug/metabolite transporter (DMT)-like permease